MKHCKEGGGAQAVKVWDRVTSDTRYIQSSHELIPARSASLAAM
jgi:hypothetical protein